MTQVLFTQWVYDTTFFQQINVIFYIIENK